jgi:hypothetical protein
VFDVVTAIGVSVGRRSPPPYGGCDADCDGGVSIFDVLAIIDAALGKPAPSCAAAGAA